MGFCWGFYCEIMRILLDFVGLLCNFMGFYGDQWEFKQKKQGTMWGPQDTTITVEFMGDI